MPRYILYWCIACFFINGIQSSIIDNRTTNDTTTAYNGTYIRSVRNYDKPSPMYLPGPYRTDFPPIRVEPVTQGIYTVWNACKGSDCNIGYVASKKIRF
ncbi:hypothetical protein CAEBREN_08553 [Caenorhabditis brenneri]|uniref:Uncharacterized protein n=1 Tax=Caenorhabditis brenneri TaxID=135651 RepID=G0MIE8_CAEBE|nr:hypothetical protein CAEBREN_08553 [Caenorhabditis brenneri]